MKTTIGLIITLAVYIVLIWKRDRRRTKKYEQWKKDEGLTTEECGI